MKKKILLIFIMSIAVGTMLVVQMRNGGGQGLYTSSKALDDYSAMIETEKKTTADIRNSIEEKKGLLREYEASLRDPGNTAVMDNIEHEHEKFGIFSGASAAEGPGVEITLDDGKRELFFGEDVNNLIVHDLDILMIINELKYCGAEAISVNGQRIVDTTAINCSGWTIRINGRTYARPFVIKAIGDGKKMAAELLSPNGYGTFLNEWGVIFKVEFKEHIKIEAYKEERGFVYAEGMEGDNK